MIGVKPSVGSRGIVAYASFEDFWLYLKRCVLGHVRLTVDAVAIGRVFDVLWCFLR